MADTKQATAEARTQPSQTELRIPDDLRGAYDACNVILSTEGVDEPWVALCKRYIERIARLEGAGRWHRGKM